MMGVIEAVWDVVCKSVLETGTTELVDFVVPKDVVVAEAIELVKVFVCEFEVFVCEVEVLDSSSSSSSSSSSPSPPPSSSSRFSRPKYHSISLSQITSPGTIFTGTFLKDNFKVLKGKKRSQGNKCSWSCGKCSPIFDSEYWWRMKSN
jgi:hypothetical protein